MRVTALMVVAAGLLVAADAPKDDVKKELKKLEGTWVLVSGEQEGKEFSEDIIKSGKLTMTGDKHTVKVGKDTIVGTHTVDPSKKPKTIDATDTEGPFKGKTTLGIYEGDDDQFKVCFAAPDKERPKEFTSKSGTGVFVHVWKREKK